MYLSNILFSSDAFCTVLLGIVAITGDILVKYAEIDVYKALFDNSTHSIIGGLSWFIISNNVKKKRSNVRLFEIGLCAFIASVIDLDHFFVARSFRLKDATNINGRAPLHCTTFPIVATILLLIYVNYFVSENIFRFAWLFFAAFISHHTRDATRRGFWFYRFGSTPSIPYGSYVLSTMLLPFVISFTMNLTYVQSNYNILETV